MTPFFGGMAIGVGVGAIIFALCLMIAVLIIVVRFIAYFCYFARRDITRKWREDRAAAMQARLKAGKPILTPSKMLCISWIRLWRIVRHPIRERAFIAESFRALRHPNTHRWSDGLS